MSTLPTTFWAKTQPEANGCIIWTAALNSRGYGCFFTGGSSKLAHRLAYEDARGPVPGGLVIDHLCRVRNCVNPDHMEPVTVAENNRRGVNPTRPNCKRGHPLGQRRRGEKTVRCCRTCEAEDRRARRVAARQEIAA